MLNLDPTTMSVGITSNRFYTSSEKNWMKPTAGLSSDTGQRSKTPPDKILLTNRQKILILTSYIVSIYLAASQLAATMVDGSSRASLRAVILVSRATFGAISVHLTTKSYDAVNSRLKDDESVLCNPSVTSSWTGTGELKRSGKSNSRKPRRLLTKLFILVYCSTLLATIVGDQMLGGQPRVDFGCKLVWNSSLIFMSDGLRKTIQVLDISIGSAALVAPCAAVYWYIGVCSWAHHRVIYFRERIYDLLSREEDMSAGQLRSLQGLYQRLWSVISFLDEKLGKAVFVWHADLVANIILGIRVIQKADHWLQGLESSAYLLYAVVFFFIISVVAANVVVESRNIDYDLCRLVCQVDASDWKASNQIMLLQEEVQHCPLAFTGWNCFTLDRGYILTVAGAIVTYAVVLQQLT